MNSSTIAFNSHPTLYKYFTKSVWQIGADPRVAKLPLMSDGPWTVLLIIASYLMFVKVVGPRLMKDRPPFDLRSTIFCYNVIMMLINAYFFIFACYHTNFGLNTWSCISLDPLRKDPVWDLKLRVVWLFLMTKFVDLMETIFFVLRKKQTQISVLHVFHHAIVPIDVWVGLKYSPSESACFFPFVNSFVHTLMYFYYALSTFGPRVKPFLWWKKYLTQIQIIQLALIALHCVHLVLLPNCNIPKALFIIYLPQALLLVYLFVAFFIKAYIVGETVKKSD